ncbi:uncharacterized protein GGS22DRAFT_164341 [Annulohypoxylon maeteangense]|uniref:uncharacterized protein n=1 Tax=Annulohypoxylon maeteangense TaxID=1927788 RepID=UPI002007AA6E|nr:uncharacterized protein GGS22DRAFT_164341 [Annulohypoxylon maeteangense]KAI0884786.1 hypothetical protein GGS22DRAFT_164341 [Annulohypoxylon maeteangense]
MLTKTAILAAALSATASAQLRSPALLARATRTLETASKPESTESSSPECLSRIQSWTAAFPTPAPALEDALDDADNSESGVGAEGLEGLCDFAAEIPASVTAAFTSYNLEMYSYLSAQSSNLLVLATSCSTDMGAEPSVITSQLGELLNMYSSFSAGACGTITATASATSASATKSASKSGLTSVVSNTGSVTAAAETSSTGSSASSSASGSAATTSGSSANASTSPTVSQNAGPRETGMLAAAAIAMGVLGAAVVL